MTIRQNVPNMATMVYSFALFHSEWTVPGSNPTSGWPLNLYLPIISGYTGQTIRSSGFLFVIFFSPSVFISSCSYSFTNVTGFCDFFTCDIVAKNSGSDDCSTRSKKPFQVWLCQVFGQSGDVQVGTFYGLAARSCE